MRYTKIIFSLVLCAFLSCQNPTKNNQTISDTFAKTHAFDEQQEKYLSNIQSNPRYSIIQSTLAAKGTFKLDSYVGDVYQLVLNSIKDEAWQRIRKLNHSTLDTKNDNTSNYILFVSTIAMRFTYLMNVNTGATWQLVQDPKTNESFFSPIE